MDKSWKFFKTVKFSTNVVLNKIGTNAVNNPQNKLGKVNRKKALINFVLPKILLYHLASLKSTLLKLKS